MPRQYKRKTNHGLASHDIMLQGVQLVIGGMPVRKAAEQQGVSKSALCRYVMKYRGNPAVVLTPNYRHSQVFSMEQEDTLAEYLETSSQMFHGLTPKLVRKLAYEMVCINKLHMPKNGLKKNRQGRIGSVDFCAGIRLCQSVLLRQRRWPTLLPSMSTT